jgi:hypothetical protein
MEKYLEGIAYHPIVEGIMKDVGVDRETAAKAMWSFGEFMYERSDDNDEFIIPPEAFDEYVDEEDLGDGC